MIDLDTIAPASMEQITDAIVMAAVTGSVGSTARREERDCQGQLKGEPTFTTVERVVYAKTSPASLWRVTASSDSAVVGLVLVNAALPDRHTSHAR